MTAPLTEPMESRTFLSAGQLDTVFGDGYKTISFAAGPAQLVDVQERADGLLIGLGYYTNQSGSHLFLARFGPFGDLTTEWGGGTLGPGFVDIGIDGSSGVLKLLKHSQVLVASGSHLARFNDDGSVDPSFVRDEPSRYKFAFKTLAIDVQPDGKILLSGRYKQTAAKPGHFAVARLKGSGGRDKDFGAGGVADFWQHTNSKGSSVRAMADGSIYVGGDINYGYPNDITEYTDQRALCVKLRSDGSLDPGYGTDGVAKIAGRYFAGSNMVSTVAPDGTATVVAAGDDNYLYRFTPTGARDNRFDGDGVATGPRFNGGSVIVADQDDGAVLMSYIDYTTDQPPRVDKLVRWSPAGAQDSAFGTNGQATFQIGSSDTIFNVIRQTMDGCIVVAGRADDKLMLARFWVDDAPAVRVLTRNLKAPGIHHLEMRCEIRDDVGIDGKSITGSTFQIKSPTGATITPALAEVGRHGNAWYYGTLLIPSESGLFDPADNGEWQIRLAGNTLRDTDGHYSAARAIGVFWVNIS